MRPRQAVFGGGGCIWLRGGGSVIPVLWREAKLDPVAFFSWKLSPAEQSSDVSNWDLLAVKLPMDKWWHWLEGATYPFVVLTDHKNLKYLRTAECLNPCQACWSLLFTRFQFTLSYCPGSKNMKTISLSQIHTNQNSEACPDPILPLSCFIQAIMWDQEIPRALVCRVPNSFPQRILVFVANWSPGCIPHQLPAIPVPSEHTISETSGDYLYVKKKKINDRYISPYKILHQMNKVTS